MNSDFLVGVHGLVFLYHKKETLSSEVMAQNICTNPARVRKVMTKLKKAGLLVTKEGKNGGYCYSDQLGEITLAQVLTALEEVVVKNSWLSGDVNMQCLVASGMAEVMSKVYADLNLLCMNGLRELQIKEIEETLIQKEQERKERNENL
ncbi:MAG: Rrf2 family transcriptional regulator [Anaerovoracaceae bacterium]